MVSPVWLIQDTLILVSNYSQSIQSAVCVQHVSTSVMNVVCIYNSFHLTIINTELKVPKSYVHISLGLVLNHLSTWNDCWLFIAYTHKYILVVMRHKEMFPTFLSLFQVTPIVIVYLTCQDYKTLMLSGLWDQEVPLHFNIFPDLEVSIVVDIPYYWRVIRRISFTGVYSLLNAYFAVVLNIPGLKKVLFIRRISPISAYFFPVEV